MKLSLLEDVSFVQCSKIAVSVRVAARTERISPVERSRAVFRCMHIGSCWRLKGKGLLQWELALGRAGAGQLRPPLARMPQATVVVMCCVPGNAIRRRP